MSNLVLYSRIQFGAPRFLDTQALRGQSFRINSPESSRSNQNDEAVKVSLSEESKAKAKASELAQTEEVVTKRRSGAIYGLLDRLSEITSRLQELRQSSDTEQLNNEQRLATDTELNALNDEYQQIISSKPYERIMQLSEFARNSLQSGTSGSDVYAAFRGEAGLLGEDFLSLIQHGRLFELGMLHDKLSQIGSTDIKATSASPDLLAGLSDTIKKAYEALSAPPLESEKEEQSARPLASLVQIAPQATETIYAGSEEVALVLKSYSSADMIKAALSGVDIGPISTLSLVKNPNSDHEDPAKGL